jgi:exosortase/archaeosortase family protein
MNYKDLFQISTRYLILLVLSLGNLYLIYLVFTPLTIYPVYFILNLFYSTTLQNTSLIFNSKIIHLIPACIAGAGIYFLIILNLSTSMNLKKRIYSLVFSLLSFLIINILRIIILSFFFINSFTFFDLSHKIFWYSLSVIFVVIIWFSEVKIFKIKNIPFYTDIKNILKEIKKAF